MAASTGSICARRLPAMFLCHGGGPMPLMGHESHTDLLKTYEKGSDSGIYEAVHSPDVKAIVFISAHHESTDNSVLISADVKPDLLFDYGGFPKHTYEYTLPNPGSPEIASNIADELTKANISHKMERGRGLDHGVFVPLLLLEVDKLRPSLPILSLSLRGAVDYATDQSDMTLRHWEMGKALSSLRDQGILFIGSGMSYHNMQILMGQGNGHRDAQDFDTYLGHLATYSDKEDKKDLRSWQEHEAAKRCHPRPEHLLPLIVIAGSSSSNEHVSETEEEAAYASSKVTQVKHSLLGIPTSHFIFQV